MIHLNNNNVLALVCLLSIWVSSVSPAALSQRMPGKVIGGDTRGLQAEAVMEADGDLQGVCYTTTPFDPIRHKSVYKVGVLAIRGPESAFAEWNKSMLACCWRKIHCDL